ncbi:MAG: cation-translocating P-type ATPase [Planctomycetaceae bacterium]
MSTGRQTSSDSSLTRWIFGGVRPSAAELSILHAVLTTSLFLAGAWLSPNFIDPAVSVQLQFLAAAIAAVPCCVRLLRSLKSREADSYSDQLVALAVLGAIIGREYAAAVLVPVIMDIGHFLEQRGIQGTQAAIAGLKRLSSGMTIRLDDGRPVSISTQDVKQGDRLLIRPGDVIPADGRVCSGSGSIDESSFTGESIPREVGEGDLVNAGTMNLNGRLEIIAKSVGDQTAIGRIRELLSAAAQSRTPFTRLVERYSELYVPIVILLAGVIFYQTRQLDRVVAILVVSCPCALVLAGPSAMIAALARCTSHGILIRSSRFLESLATANTVIFDKTGTLTEGHLVVSRIVPAGDADESAVLKYAGLCAAASSHPVSKAIAREALRREIILPTPEAVSEFAGRGTEVSFGDLTLRMGRPDWVSPNSELHDSSKEHSGPLVAVSCNGKWLGCLHLADQIRPDAPELIQSLRQLGYHRLLMLTGDRREAALPVARSLKLDCVVSESLPQQKLEHVRTETEAGHKVIVVGDGINDALALAAGDVGIAMGARGSDIAIQSSDIALMTNDLGRIAQAISLSRTTRAIITQNIVIATVSSAAMLLFGTLGAFTAVTGAILHNAGTAAVIANSARLLRVDLFVPTPNDTQLSVSNLC